MMRLAVLLTLLCGLAGSVSKSRYLDGRESSRASHARASFQSRITV